MPEPIQKPGRSKQDYRTPREFITAACDRLGIDRFVFDFAADPFNAVVYRQMTVSPGDLAVSCQRQTEAGWYLELAMTSASGAMVILLFSRWSNEPLDTSNPRLPLDAEEEAVTR